MPQPSVRLRNLLETAVLQIQHAPDLNKRFVGFNSSQRIWLQNSTCSRSLNFCMLRRKKSLPASPN